MPNFVAVLLSGNAFTHGLRAFYAQYLSAFMVPNCTAKYKIVVCFLLLIVATRETSFVHAISAAGVMYTLTKNCSMGDFDNCGCDDSRIGQTGTFLF